MQKTKSPVRRAANNQVNVLEWIRQFPAALNKKGKTSMTIGVTLTVSEWLAYAQAAKEQESSIGDVMSEQLSLAACEVMNNLKGLE